MDESVWRNGGIILIEETLKYWEGRNCPVANFTFFEQRIVISTY